MFVKVIARKANELNSSIVYYYVNNNHYFSLYIERVCSSQRQSLPRQLLNPSDVSEGYVGRNVALESRSICFPIHNVALVSILCYVLYDSSDFIPRLYDRFYYLYMWTM